MILKVFPSMLLALLACRVVSQRVFVNQTVTLLSLLLRVSAS